MKNTLSWSLPGLMLVLGGLAGCRNEPPPPPDAAPPSIIERHQPDTEEISPGSTVNFRVRAKDPQGSPLDFTWTAQEGLLQEAPSLDIVSSEVSWTVPSCVPAGHDTSLTATVTNALGLSAQTRFQVRVGHKPCVRRTIVAGVMYSLALHDDGTVWAWGNNLSGQLGDGSTLLRPTPVQVQGLSHITALSAATTDPSAKFVSHVLALRSDGTVWAWGENMAGQLGDGSSTSRTTPVQVQGLSSVIAVAAGARFSLALRSDGTVWAWGLGWYGELGNDALSRTSIPAQVPNLAGITAISAGYAHALALGADSNVWAWGHGFYSQLGNGSTPRRSPPVRVQGLSQVLTISAGGYHSLALRSDGTVWAWGRGWSGELGNGSGDPSAVPVQVKDLTGVTALAAGYNHSLALRSDGTLWAWGYGYKGELGNGTKGNSHSPVQVTGLTGVTAFAAGYDHSLALRADGTLWAWGSNRAGQLGDGLLPVSSQPGRVAGDLPHPVTASVGRSHALALRSDGTVWAWGSNIFGELGDGRVFSDFNPASRTTPGQVVGLSDATAISAGDEYSLALRSDGTVWAWGRGWEGELGNDALRLTSLPAQVPNLSSVTAISAGSSHALALRSDGTVWGWGSNSSGQLGRRSCSYMCPAALQVEGISNVIAIGGQERYSLALRSDGTVWAWGSSHFGLLGDGAPLQSDIPLQVSGLSHVIAISVGPRHSLALRSDGTVWAWGQGALGQLGDGSFVKHTSTPVQVVGLSEVVSIRAGNYDSAAVRADGTVWVWGEGTYGQPQTSNLSPLLRHPLPVQVTELTQVAELVPGGGSSGSGNVLVVRRKNGSLYGWGENMHGQLGNGSRRDEFVPIQPRLP